MTKVVNIIKLCVGAEDVSDLQHWQDAQRHRWPEGRAVHVTRSWPKREAEALKGSLFWVFKGQILARQRILGFEDATGADGITRCAFQLDPEIIRTQATPRRPFQGWRYLEAADSPPDLPKSRPADDLLPPELEAALAEMGLR
ncbi:DUF1489 family protein [Falsigemmobacter faecalis]|uniref:DUF1489 family protein n=1 Tax=Falsigemmobacter faecalis TaxID=2488730 RepID=A0A3P3DSZ8_9RHOB|nr:DUF1489 domain-containing protein [Falsigemmobacter faecalis]RRH77390.1 DUF1489 family protein [Falsigemmobacter faecalis]